MLLPHILKDLVIGSLRKWATNPLPTKGIPLEKEIAFKNFVAGLSGLTLLLLGVIAVVYYFLFWGLQILVVPLIRQNALFFFSTSEFILVIPALLLAFFSIVYLVYVTYARLKLKEDWPLFINWFSQSFRLNIFRLSKNLLRIGIALAVVTFFCLQSYYTRADDKNIYVHTWLLSKETVIPVEGISRIWYEAGASGNPRYFIQHKQSSKPIELKGGNYTDRLEAWKCLNWLGEKRGLTVEQVFRFF